MNIKNDLKLYLITDRRWLNQPIESAVRCAIEGGVTMIQVREKDTEYQEFVDIARKIKAVADEYTIPVIINDNIDVALAVDASGVHVGQSDTDVTKARELLGEDKIIGLTANTVEKAQLGEKMGADYIGVGSVFSTSSKDVEGTIGTDCLKSVAESVDIPAVAIGGISKENIGDLKGSSIDGVAVISAILKEKDIKEAAEGLVDKVGEIVS